MSRTVRGSQRARWAPGRRAGAVLHLVGGFTLAVLALGAGLLFAGTGREQVPLSDAAEQSAAVAAVQIALGGDQPPVLPSVVREIPTPQPFLDADAQLNPRGVTRLVLGSVGIDADVRSVGFSFFDGRLQYDVPRLDAGQYVGSALPGTPGNTVIGGHVSLRGGTGVFHNLPDVKAGDVVEVYSGDRLYRYSITEIKVVGSDATTVMQQTHDATLTLITCFPNQDYSQRLVVVGKLL